MIADMPSHIRTLFLFLDSVRILSCFASSHHSDSLSIHSCLRSYRREYNKGTSLINSIFQIENRCTVNFFVGSTQADDSVHQFPRDPSGKMRKSHRKSLGRGSNIPVGNFSGFFSGGFLPTYCAFCQEPAGNH